MEIGQEIKIMIEDMTPEGMGVGRYKDAVVFVEGALWQDEILAEITGKKKRFFFAKTVKIIKTSPEREEPWASHGEDGCIFNGLSYEAEQKIKKRWIANALNRIGGMDIPPFNLYTGETVGYRNKADLKVQEGKIGFFERKSHRLIPLEEHPIVQPAINRTFSELKEAIRQNPSVTDITVMANEKEDIVVIFHKKNKAPWKGEVNPTWMAYESVSRQKTRRLKALNQERLFTRQIGNRVYALSPDSFFQINRYMTEKLFDLVKEFANLKQGERLVELYSGVGAMSLYLAKQNTKIIGVEVVPSAVKAAKENAKKNGIPSADYYLGKSENLFEQISQTADVLLVDPPRAGLDKKLIRDILKHEPKRIVYVSCNPASLARDLFLLKEKYDLNQLAAVDMFPRTGHVETVALLSKLNVDKHISVEVELDELDLTSAESKATYAQIKEYILEKFGLKVSALYIAQIKNKCGIELRENYNKSKKEKQVIPQCTPEKEEAIMDALRHFKMI